MAFKIMRLRRSWLKVLAWLTGAGLTTGLMLLAASYLYLAPGLPPAAELRQVEFQIPLRIYSAEGSLIGEFGEQRRSPVDYEELPPLFIQALLSAEDERFFEHRGVDVAGLIRATLELLRYQEIRSGGSTITMQVARNFFLSRDQRFLRKFNEIVLALQIENLLTKEEILELYLNKIYLGHRSYGAEAAARVYYGRSIDELELPQWAMIAGLPKAPSAYNPISNPERARQRRDWILDRMHENDAITEEQLRKARAAEITADYHGPTPDLEASYFAEMVRQEVVERYGTAAYTRGMRVYTTLEDKRQKAGVQALRTGLHQYDERHGWRGPEDTVEVENLPELPSADSENEPGASTRASDDTEDETEDEQEDPATEPVEQWADKLDAYTTFGHLEPALVARVEAQHARLILPDAQQVSLPMSRMEWARPYLDIDTVGDPPDEPADVLDAGDIVRLRPVDTDDGPPWRLAQMPRAQGGLVSLDPDDGSVRALQGGYSFGYSKYNRVTQSRRQVGSAFKPFIYTAALENGLTPATMVNDAPIVFEDKELETVWRPTGAGSRFYGPTRLREGLYRSLNLVSIRVLQQVGISNALDTLDRMGLPTERFPRDLSLALGSASLTPMELATAYTIFANGGYRVEPWFIERIENDDGEVIQRAPARLLCEESEDGEEQCRLAHGGKDEGGKLDFPLVPIRHERVLDERTAWLMHSMLRDVVERGTGRRANALGRSDIAGKTGTTNDQVDAWFSGYMPELVATAWIGFDTPSSLGAGEYGGRAALPIWMAYMKEALQGVPQQPPSQPSGLVSVRINPDNGKRARPGNDKAIFEYFREGNLPEREAGASSASDEDENGPGHLF
jgi:penicillin-binding protein 1A